MGNFRFYRRVHIFPGLSVILTKSGPSLTVGVRGAHVTFGRSGVSRTVGLPGTGLYYTSRTGRHTGFHSAHTETPVDAAAQDRAARIIGVLLLGLIALVILLISVAIGSIKPHR